MKRRLVLPLLSGIASGYGFSVWRGFQDVLRWTGTEWISWLTSFVLIAVLSFSLIEPLRERMRSADELDVREQALSRRSWIILLLPFPLIIGVEFSFFVFHHLVSVQPFVIWTDIAGGMVIVGGITYQWLLGAHSKRRPALRGFLAGMVLAMVYVWFKWAVNQGQLIVRGQYIPVSFGYATWTGFNNGLLFWGLLGFVGGIALWIPLKAIPAVRVAIFLILSVIGTDVLFGGNVWADLFKVFGWSAALWLYRLPELRSEARQGR